MNLGENEKESLRETFERVMGLLPGGLGKVTKVTMVTKRERRGAVGGAPARN